MDDIEQASSTLLASKKVRDAVAGAGLTGIEFYDPVGYKLKRDTPKCQEVLRQARDEFQFQVMHFTGRGGSIANVSGMTLRKSCDACGWKEWTLPEQGYHIDERQWDGSDFFHVEEGPAFMSERAVQALRSADLSNFGAMDAADYRLPAGYKQLPIG